MRDLWGSRNFCSINIDPIFNTQVIRILARNIVKELLTGHVFTAFLVRKHIIAAAAVRIIPMSVILFWVGVWNFVVAGKLIGIEYVLDGKCQSLVTGRIIVVGDGQYRGHWSHIGHGSCKIYGTHLKKYILF